jgi:hypothetical protein
MKNLNHLFIFLIISVLTAACGSNSAEGGDGNEPDPTVEFSLTTTVSPDGAGSVTPSSGTFEEGTQVTIEAESSEGWKFVNWTGTEESEDNPLSFRILSDANISANFSDIRSDYLAEINLVNQDDEVALILGQKENTLTEEAPPAPPEGAFHAWILSDGEELFTDIVSETLEEVTWEVNYQTGSDSIIQLNWNVDIVKLEGSLVLTEPNESFEIDMLQESTFQINAANIENLLIIFTHE